MGFQSGDALKYGKAIERLKEDYSVEDLFFYLKRGLPVVLVLLVLSFIVLALGDNRIKTSYLLDNSTRLDHVQDNQMGTLIVHNQEPYPVFYRPESLEACIYTSSEEAPMIVDIELDERLHLSSNGIETVDLSIDIPEDELSRSNIGGLKAVERRPRCPVRSEPKIVVRQKTAEETR